MTPDFFNRSGPFPLKDLARHIGAHCEQDASIANIRTLDEAGPGDLSFFDNRKYLAAFQKTEASACLIVERDLPHCPAGVIPLIVKQPYTAYAALLRLFYPQAARPQPLTAAGISPAAMIDPSAVIGLNVTIEAGAVVGPQANIGANAQIGPHAVIGFNVVVGDDSAIGAGCVVQHAAIGSRVILHPGVKVGQDGFGYAFSVGQHHKVPQIGRVVIGDDVEIGANTTIDRGALRDTMIGDGSKIDNLVQIGHNVVIGKHCVIVGKVGISGSSTLKDFVMIGGASSVAGHVTIGEGAQIAAVSTVKDDVPPGGRYGGVPAKPVRQWFREMAALTQLANKTKDQSGKDD